MPSLIKSNRLERDPFTLFALPEGADARDADLPAVPLLVPFALWLARRDALLARNIPIGVVLEPTDVPAELGDDLHRLAVVAVRFPKFVDGRGYSIAWQLRRRLGYRGELRALGDVQRDQLFYLSRSGFDAFELKDGADPREALSSLREFTASYQQAADGRLPRFRAAPAAQPHRG